MNVALATTACRITNANHVDGNIKIWIKFVSVSSAAHHFPNANRLSVKSTTAPAYGYVHSILKRVKAGLRSVYKTCVHMMCTKTKQQHHTYHETASS